jgi:hypothetical protein
MAVELAAAVAARVPLGPVIDTEKRINAERKYQGTRDVFARIAIILPIDALGVRILS